MATTTMAPQPAFGFTFPLANDTVDQQQQQQPSLEDLGFDFSAFTNFDASPFTFDSDTTALDADISLDSKDLSANADALAFSQYMLNSTGPPSEPSLLAESTSTPASTEIVSPKSSLSSLSAIDPTSPFASSTTFNPASSFAPALDDSVLPSTIDIEALSNHHLERFLHYKALADEAQRKAEANALAQAQAQAQVQVQQQQQQSGAFQTLLAPFDFTSTTTGTDMNMSPVHPTNSAAAAANATKSLHGSMLLSYAAPPAAVPPRLGSSFAYDPNMAQASMAQAQADAHLQAHTAAAAQVHQQRMQTQYWVDSSRQSFDSVASASHSASAPMSEPAWSRSSFSSTHTGSYPSTPQYMSAPSGPLAPIPQGTAVKAERQPTMMLAPLVAPLPPLGSIASHAAPGPLAVGAPHSMPMLPASASSSTRSNSSTDSVSYNKPILNPHGGGRGYIPGKTPDDPKKRHKCDICGRGFARAFNLKSHMATHDPERSKPHMCPHYACKRGFSRLHDLERHRQGIHNDGPLVDAKTHGVTPSVARAQFRSQKSSSSTSTHGTSASASSSDAGPHVPMIPYTVPQHPSHRQQY